MKINLQELFEKQAELNELIATKHHLNYQEIREEAKLALMAEIMELCNETRCFNYWSNKARSADDVILEEYADVMHFMLTEALLYDTPREFEISYLNEQPTKKDLVHKFLELIQYFNLLQNRDTCYHMMVCFLELGYTLGYNFSQIEAAYDKKWEKNIKLQREEF